MTKSIVFPKNPLTGPEVDLDWFFESKFASGHGFNVETIDIDNLPNLANVNFLSDEYMAATLAFYRGWMVTPHDYKKMFNFLLQKNGLRLVNTPAQYQVCHELPGWYDTLASFTPKTIFVPVPTNNAEWESLLETVESTFGNSPIVVKDYVKSQKFYWDTACFIPSANNYNSVVNVTRRFLDLQGDSLAGGLAFRQYVELEQVGQSPTGFPFSREFRVFFFGMVPFFCSRSWPGQDYEFNLTEALVPEIILELGKVDSRFFAIDFAKTVDGQWIIMELGDGQVSGVEEIVPMFYRTLRGVSYAS